MEALGVILREELFVGKLPFQLLTSVLDMALGLYSSYKRSSMPQENHRHSQLNGLDTGERVLLQLMLILQQLPRKIFCKRMVLLFSILLMVGQTLDSTMEQILVKMRLIDYKADITSYDYDAPIRESEDVNNAKFNGENVVFRLSFMHFY
ncbi:hypothetical protein QN277_022415 [Acacia crassicarpa]|uniref:Uncharacterized protein n=1 Tax=Acacia crassicarpa TaxID=499986 RepID=A0AAE1MKY1_9FABA|nr:hypothetical protein QN277_022415 [Acacia crassicarpa]